jgi:hypothetical protein
VSDPVDLAPGSYAVSIRAAGAQRSAPPVLSVRVDLPPAAARTVTLSGTFADLGLHTLVDDRSAPPVGSARVRVIAAAGEATALDVDVAGGPSLAVALPVGAAGRTETVPAGPAVLVARAGGTATEAPISFAAGSIVTVLVLDSPDGGLLVRPVVDAAGPAVVPVGGVEAGTGPLTRALRPAGVLAAGAPVTAAGSAAPLRLLIPTAGVDAALTGAALDATGALVPPANPAAVGWYVGGPRPGETGPAVVTGHVDWAGTPGVFARLAGVGVDAEVRVVRADGSTMLFRTTRVVRLPKDHFPTSDVYGPTSDAELRLITCGGSFDRSRGSYEDNVVVFARAVG